MGGQGRLLGGRDFWGGVLKDELQLSRKRGSSRREERWGRHVRVLLKGLERESRAYFGSWRVGWGGGRVVMGRLEKLSGGRGCPERPMLPEEFGGLFFCEQWEE